MSGDFNYVRFLSGLITEEEMRSQMEPQAPTGAEQPATRPVTQPATQDAPFNFTNPVVAGRKVDRHQMHKDFYWWMQQQDRNDYDLAELFDALAHSKIMEKFVKEYVDSANWNGDKFKTSVGMSSMQRLV